MADFNTFQRLRPGHWLLGAAWLMGLSGCSGARPRPAETTSHELAQVEAPPAGPTRLVLVEEPLELQDEQEPFMTEAVFDFDLPRRPRRARLKVRFSGVPGATSEDTKMGRFRDKVELNNAFLMDLNTFSTGESDVAEHTKWISPGMFRRHNQLKFIAGNDGNRERRPDCDEYQLRSVVLEFDW
jgi:hypothetical protein